MNSRSTTRREPSSSDHGALCADRRFRLDRDAVTAIPRTAINEAAEPARPAGLLGLIARAVATLQRWQDRAYSRRELATFDRRMLRDIGVSPYDAGREINKPFWRH